MKTKIKKYYTLIVLSAIVLIVAFTTLYANEFQNNLMYFIAGLASSFMIFSVYSIIYEKKRGEEFENYLSSIDSLLNNDLKCSDFKYSDNNLFIKKLNVLIKNVIDDIIRQKRFSGDVAHELKTPLTILRGELELALRKDLSKDEYQKVISSSLDEVMRLIKILQAVMEISSANSGKIELKFSNHNFTHFLKDLMDDARILSDKKQIEIIYDIEENIKFEFDKLRMQQALLNLVENAVKYTDENGKIWINAKNQGDRVVIKIKDNGIGIPKDKQKFIFDRFFQIKDSPDSKNGAGIGLSIVKWIVAKHNAEIYLNSDIGKGSEFILTFPKVQNDKVRNTEIARTE